MWGGSPQKIQPKTSIFEQSFSPIDITNSPFLTPDEIALWGPPTSILSFLPSPPPNITKKGNSFSSNAETRNEQKKKRGKRAPSKLPSFDLPPPRLAPPKVLFAWLERRYEPPESQEPLGEVDPWINYGSSWWSLESSQFLPGQRWLWWFMEYVWKIISSSQIQHQVFVLRQFLGRGCKPASLFFHNHISRCEFDAWMVALFTFDEWIMVTSSGVWISHKEND